MNKDSAPELQALLVSREKLRDQIAADPDIPTEAISEHWNEKYLNTLHDYVELEQRLAAAAECLRSRNCDDLCLVHIQRAEAVETELQAALEALQHARPLIIDAGDDEDPEVRLRAIATLREIDKAIRAIKP